MSSFLSRTTSLAYLEFAAIRLQAEGHATEIVTSAVTGQTVLRVNGIEHGERDVSRLLAARSAPESRAALG